MHSGELVETLKNGKMARAKQNGAFALFGILS